MTCEHWIDLVEFKGRYQVSQLGRVRRLPWPDSDDARLMHGKILSPRLMGGGRPYVTLNDREGAPRQLRLDRLVICAWAGEPYSAFDVAHRNNRRSDCRLENLIKLRTVTVIGNFRKDESPETSCGAQQSETRSDAA